MIERTNTSTRGATEFALYIVEAFAGEVIEAIKLVAILNRFFTVVILCHGNGGKDR